MRRIPVTEVNKLIRKDLKTNFPGVKFSVRKSDSGQCAEIEYRDASITEKQVQAIVGKYAGSTFDAMTDSRNYHNSELNGEVVWFMSDFVFVRNAAERW